MKDDQTSIDTMVGDIFKLDSPVINRKRESKIHQFINSTIHGDTPKKYLAINARLAKDTEGAIVYVLTNTKLIEIDIDIEAKKMQSSSFFFDAITKIERKLLDGDRVQIKIFFQNDFFGLRYEPNQKIAHFFQAIDQLRG